MGQEESLPVPSCQELVRNSEGEYIVISNALPESFYFQPAESFLVSYGIDEQSAPKFRHKSLSSIAVQDAKQVLNAFVAVETFPGENASLFSASQTPESCTAQGMKKTFQDCARKVGERGLFVFHFSGHGIAVGNKTWGLAPMDFDYSAVTLITADVLGKWLSEVQCRAKYILITLDCCYAGGIGKELATQVDAEHDTSLYILSACTANETSVVLASLGHSIFTYFLSNFILKFSEGTGILPTKKIFSECQVCCEYLSSLLVGYSKESGLQPKIMQPQVSVRNIMSDSVDFTDSATVPIGRFNFVQELYDHTKQINPLDTKSLAYLETLCDIPDGPLIQLEKRGLLKGRLIVSAFCSIMYSLASIEVACDSSGRKTSNINLSITAFMQAAATIDLIQHGVQCDGFTFLLSWLFYKEVMKRNAVPVEGLSQLEKKLKSLYAPSTSVSQRGEDVTDSTEMDDMVSGYIVVTL